MSIALDEVCVTDLRIPDSQRLGAVQGRQTGRHRQHRHPCGSDAADAA